MEVVFWDKKFNFSYISRVKLFGGVVWHFRIRCGLNHCVYIHNFWRAEKAGPQTRDKIFQKYRNTSCAITEAQIGREQRNSGWGFVIKYQKVIFNNFLYFDFKWGKREKNGLGSGSFEKFWKVFKTALFWGSLPKTTWLRHTCLNTC